MSALDQLYNCIERTEQLFVVFPALRLFNTPLLLGVVVVVVVLLLGVLRRPASSFLRHYRLLLARGAGQSPGITPHLTEYLC